MKAGWEMVALGSVCDKIQDGAHHSPKETFLVRAPGTFPYVTSKNIRNWFLDEVDVTFVGSEFHDTIYPRCNAEFGDVLLTKDGSNTGQVTINTFREPISLLSSVCLIKPNKAKLDPRFLVYYIQSDAGFENITGQMTGAAIKRIILKRIKSSEVPLPPLEEQRRIVAILDEVFEGLECARAHAESNLQNARELFESFLGDVFHEGDWPEKTLNEISENLDRIRVPITKGNRIAGNIPYYGASGVVDHVADFLFNEDLLLVSEDGANLLARTYPIAFSISGQSWVNNHAHVLRFTDLDTQEYVRLYLNSISLEPFVSGMAQPKLNQSQLNRIPIPFPDPAERKAIVDKAARVASQTSVLCQRYQTKVQDLDELRQSLLQRAFAGKLA